jgi:hypothetical protein
MEKGFEYKVYTAEESEIYENAMAKIRSALGNGLSFNEACATVDIADGELKKFVFADALKVMIAEMHYAKGIPLIRVAEELKTPIADINRAHMEMLEDAGIMAAEEFNRSDSAGIFGNA